MGLFRKNEPSTSSYRSNWRPPRQKRFFKKSFKNSLIFVFSGISLGAGLWFYLWGMVDTRVHSPSTRHHPMLFDFLSLLPLLIGLATHFLLNTMLDRRCILPEDNEAYLQAYYAGETSRGSKGMGFLGLIVLFCTIGMSLLLGFTRYGLLKEETRWAPNMAIGVLMETIMVTISALLVFFGRALPEPYF